MMDDFARLLLAVLDQKIARAKQRRTHERKPVRDDPPWTCLPENRAPRAGLTSLGAGCYMRTIARSGRK